MRLRICDRYAETRQHAGTVTADKEGKPLLQPLLIRKAGTRASLLAEPYAKPKAWPEHAKSSKTQPQLALLPVPICNSHPHN